MKNKKKIIKIAINILGLLSHALSFTKTFDVYNNSDQDLPPNAVKVYGVACADQWNSTVVKAHGGHFRWDTGGGCCYDSVDILGKRYNMHLPCRIAGPTIEIQNNGIYLINGQVAKRGTGGLSGVMQDIEDSAIDWASQTAKAFQSLGDQISGAFKDLGSDFSNGFNKLGSCMQVAGYGTELAAKIAAKETVLSKTLTDEIVESARQAALQPLYASKKAAQAVLDAAKLFLEKAGKPIVAGSLQVAGQIAKGSLQAGQAVATGVLTAADEFTKAVLNSFNVEKIEYKGSLQELAQGNLGNVQCIATFFSHSYNFNFDMNVHAPLGDIQKLAQKLADNFLTAMKASSNAIKQFFSANNKLNAREDMITLAMNRKINFYM